jgi:NADPH:quinone reductase-like Zn-dependent oxidoreductase
MLRGPILSMFVGQTFGWLNAKATKEDLQALSELIEAGSVTSVVDRTFDLAEAAGAVRYLAEGHPAGKIVVTV